MAPSPYLSLARLIGHIHPAAWDGIIPHSRDASWLHLLGPSIDPSGPSPNAWGPQPEPWRGGLDSEPWRRRSAVNAVTISPQPIPVRHAYALALTDATIADVVALNRSAELAHGDASEGLRQRALSRVSDFEETCPRWPRWPRNWPPPPPPPWQDTEMKASELLFAGCRFLLATDVVEDARLKDALNGAGHKLVEMGLERA